MLLDLSEDQRLIVETVRKFVDIEVAPVASELDHRDEYPTAIVERLKELGLFGATIPEAYGGIGLDHTTYALVIEELARGWISIASHPRLFAAAKQVPGGISRPQLALRGTRPGEPMSTLRLLINDVLSSYLK